MTSANGAVDAAQTHSADSADETSTGELIDELAKAYLDAATQLDAANNAVATMESKHDSMFNLRRDQAATSSTSGILSPRPQRVWLRHSLLEPEQPRQRPGASSTGADETALDDDDDDSGNGESIAHMRECMETGLACLEIHQQQLEPNPREHARAGHPCCAGACLGAADQSRGKMRMAAVERLRNPVAARVVPMAAERLVRRAVAMTAPVPLSASGRSRGDTAVPMSASGSRAYSAVTEVLPMAAARGRATSNGALIRRHAARRVEEQMVLDSSYPSFRPSSKRE